jgi:hypothetical protein
MSLTMRQGGPQLSAASNVNAHRLTTPENPIEFANGALRTASLTHEFPIEYIRCTIEGSINVGTASAFHARGVWNVIDELTLSLNGNTPVFQAQGYQLPYIHRIYYGAKPYTENDGIGSTGDANIFSSFIIPLDVGGYNSLLDASDQKALQLQCRWGNVSDMTDGTGSVTANDDLVLTIEPFVIAGVADGEPGGKNAGYLSQRILNQSHTVTAQKPDFEIELMSGRGYHGLTIFADSDGSLVDSIMNEVRLRRTGNTHLELSDQQVRAANWDRYRLDSFASRTGDGQDSWVGIYHVPIVEDGHPEQTLSVKPNQAMSLLCDVDNPGSDDRLEVLSHYFVR